MLSPTALLPWTRPLALIAISLLACRARADLAPAPRSVPKAKPSVELTVDGLASDHVLFTRNSLNSGGRSVIPSTSRFIMPLVFESGRTLPLGSAGRLPSVYLMDKSAFEAWRAAHPPAPARQARDVDELIASAAVVACFLRGTDDQVPRHPEQAPEWSTGDTVRLHYALAEASATRCVMREVGKPDAGVVPPPIAEAVRAVPRGCGGCALFSGGSEHGSLALAFLGLFCAAGRRRSVPGRACPPR